MQARTLLVVLALLVSQLPAQKRDLTWPGFRGPGLDGVARQSAPPAAWSAKENLAWRLKLPGPGASSPVVIGDRLFVTCYSGYGSHLDDGGMPKNLRHHLVCVDRTAGKIVWDTQVAGGIDKDAPKAQTVYHGFASPTPVSDGELVYVYFGRGGLLACDMSGEIVWQVDLGVPDPEAGKSTNSVERGGKTLTLRWGAAASPILFDDLVIVNCSEESNSIRAYQKADGKFVWKHESANLEGCATTPMLAGTGAERVLVLGLAGEVWGMEPRTGKLIWRIETGTRGGMSPTPVADDKLVYVFGGSGKSFAIRYARAATSRKTASGEGAVADRVKWSVKHNADIPSPILHDGRIYLVQTDGMSICIRADDGGEIFRERLDGKTRKVYSSPLLADGKFYVVSRKRGTFVYEMGETLKLLHRNELDDESLFNASPAVAGKRMYLRSDRYLYCVASN